MAPIVTSAEIQRPAEVVTYATDPARLSEWQKGVVDGHMDGPANGTQARAVGAKCVTPRARVLRFLPTSLSAPEIARELYVSVNTVRTHMRHVYDKLGAHRRLEAIDRARALGLLGPVPQSA
jgi:ATP/maltotriose-dependent transcriptional regulator MalT